MKCCLFIVCCKGRFRYVGFSLVGLGIIYVVR